MPALVIGMVAAAVVGYLVGLIALRRTGIYFAMITVAIAEMFFFVEFNPLSAYTGGENGLPGVPTPSFDLGFTILKFGTGWSLYGFLAFCYFVGIVIALRIVRSPVGAMLTAIRDNPLRARRGRPRHAGLQARRLRHRRRLCRFRRRPARRAAGLHAARGLHVRHVGPARHADRDRRRRHAVRAAGRRGGMAVSCSDFLQTTLGLGATWKLVLGLVFVLLVCFLRRGVIGGVEDLSPLARGAQSRADSRARQSRAGRSTRRRLASVGRSRRRAETPYRRPILRGARPDQALRRHRRQPQHRLRGRAGRAARHHRPQRRRQEHVLQDADLRDAADLGPDLVPRPRHHRHGRHRRVPARPDQELSGQPALRAADGAREPGDRGAGRAARHVPARPAAQHPTGCRASTSRSSSTLALVDLTARADVPVSRTRLWREAAARDRPGARDLAEPAAARRAARRHEPARARRDGAAAQDRSATAAP